MCPARWAAGRLGVERETSRSSRFRRKGEPRSAITYVQASDAYLQTSDPDTRFEVGRPSEFVHFLLFMQEYVAPTELSYPSPLPSLSFFLSRAGGYHLLLLLINAAYQKPRMGRPAGWPFGVLSARLSVSQRTLHKLLADGIEEGFVVRRCGKRDRRISVYCASQQVVEEWERLLQDMVCVVPDVLANFDGHELADASYRLWNPRRAASEQRPGRLVYQHIKSAVDPGAKER